MPNFGIMRIVAAWVAAATIVAASDSGAQSSFGEKIEIKLIELDVIVTDRDGHHVHGLTAGDFEIHEARRRQEITNFTEYRAARATPSLASAADASGIESHTEQRTILIIIDPLPRTGFVRETVYAHLETLLPKIAREQDRIGIVYWDNALGRPTMVLEPSASRTAALDAIRRLGGYRTADPAPSAVEDSVSPGEMMDRAMRDQNAAGAEIDIAGETATTARFVAEGEIARFRRKARALSRLVASLGATNGRKVALYVAQDFKMPAGPTDRLAVIAMVEDVARTANASGVTFYAIRPEVPDPGRPDVEANIADPMGSSAFELDRNLEALGRLTIPTGGLVDFGLQSVATLGDSLASDLSSYYSIAYRARSDGRDRERDIVVKTKNPRYRVRARRSFVEKSDETLARETVTGRLFGGDGGTDLQFEFAAGAPRSAARGRWLIPIGLRIRSDQLQYAAEGRDRVALVKILIVAANGLAEVKNVTEDDLRVVAGTNDRRGFVQYSADLLVDQNGSEISVGVYDRRSALLGVRTFEIRPR